MTKPYFFINWNNLALELNETALDCFLEATYIEGLGDVETCDGGTEESSFEDTGVMRLTFNDTNGPMTVEYLQAFDEGLKLWVEAAKEGAAEDE